MKVAPCDPDYLKNYYQNNRDKIIEKSLNYYYNKPKNVIHCDVCNKDCRFYENTFGKVKNIYHAVNEKL